MKNSMRRAMISTVCMLIVAVMSLTGVTYAWFTQGTQATVEGMQVHVTTTAGGIQVREKSADNNKPWQTKLNLQTNVTSVAPLSSADGTNFFSAVINENNTAEIASKTVSDTGNNVIIKEIQLGNSGKESIKVNLDGSSIGQITSGVTNDIYKAARVAIIVNGTVHIWAGKNNTENYNAIVVASDTAGPESTPVYFAAYEAVGTYTKSVTTTTEDAIQITLPGVTAENVIQPVDVKIVVWLEGQDADCINTNAGGAFNVTLNFKQVPAESKE